jgi:hypothetical protein
LYNNKLQHREHLLVLIRVEVTQLAAVEEEQQLVIPQLALAAALLIS